MEEVALELGLRGLIGKKSCSSRETIWAKRRGAVVPELCGCEGKWLRRLPNCEGTLMATGLGLE